MNICVVIPTFNESGNISWIVSSVLSKGYSVLVVDDGSSDNTAGLAEKNGAVVLRNSRNLGKGAALIRGFEYVKRNNFDGVITMDGDGQHLPEDIPVLLSAFRSKAAVVVGDRMSRPGNMPLARWLTNKIMSLFISCLTRQRIPDTQCGFRFLSRQVLVNLNLFSCNYEIETEILVAAARLGYKIESVQVKSVYRGSKSQINPFLDTIRFFRFICRQMSEGNKCRLNKKGE